jgi:hypothetical protein
MDVLDRLHTGLTRALESRGGDPYAPFSIGELYRQLIPYRAVRGELALLELAAYEHALLRLLAGERGYLRIEQPGVVDDLRRELREPNPILGVYRDYAAVQVQLADGGADETLEHPEASAGYEAPSLPPQPPPMSRGAFDPDSAEGGAEERSTRTRGSGLESREGEPGGSPCVRCDERLPEVAGLRFCPGCGADQLQQSCAGCGAEVLRAWSFCVHCGQPQSEGSR